MNQEDKELLLKDLCARLPYGVKCQYTCVVQEGTLVTGKSNWIGELKGIVPLSNGHIGFMVDCDKIDALEGNIKPLLRPISSMTADEEEQWEEFMVPTSCFDYENNGLKAAVFWDELSNAIDWLNKHHFDYRGLIEKGLALEAPKGIYK